MEVIITLLSDMVQLIIIIVIIGINGTISGWDGHESLMLFGYILFSGSIAEFLIGNVRRLGSEYIRTGHLDLLLVRPVGPFLQLMVGEFNISRLGSALMGLSLCWYEAVRQSLSWGAVGLLILGVIPAIIISISIAALVSAYDFWNKSPLNPLQVAEDLKQLSYYPLGIYPFLIRLVLLVVLPFAFAGYIQVAVALNKLPSLYIVLAILVCMLTVIATKWIWQKGLRNYESAN